MFDTHVPTYLGSYLHSTVPRQVGTKYAPSGYLSRGYHALQLCVSRVSYVRGFWIKAKVSDSKGGVEGNIFLDHLSAGAGAGTSRWCCILLQQYLLATLNCGDCDAALHLGTNTLTAAFPKGSRSLPHAT